MAKSKLGIIKKLIKVINIKKLQKTIIILMKYKNICNVIILFAIFLALYFIRRRFFVKEQMSCSAEKATEGFSEGLATCEEYFEIPLAKAVTAGEHVLVFSVDQSFNFSAEGGERPVADNYIAKGHTINDVSQDASGWKVTMDTSFVDMGDINSYQGNKYHVITDTNTSEVSGNELCKGFLHADWQQDPVVGADHFYVNNTDGPNLKDGMYLAEGYGVVMPPHVYRTYINSEGNELRVVLCNGMNCDGVVNEHAGASPNPAVIIRDIPINTSIKFIKQPKDSTWTNQYGGGLANNGGIGLS